MSSTDLDIRLLGRFSVRREGREIPAGEFQGRLVRTLLRLLITRAGQLVTRDYLAECLWPGRAPADPERNLNVMIARARRALGDPSLIVTGAGGYSFHPAAGCEVDAELFLAQVRAGSELLKSDRHAQALEKFRVALDLWAGDPVSEDAYEDWAQEYRRRLCESLLAALEGAAAAALGAGLPADAAALARTAAAREPLREASHLLLARSLAAAGDTAGALAVLRAFGERLADELGLDPPASVGNLERELLRGEVEVSAAAPESMAPSIPGELEFAGRQQEVAKILEALGGSGRVVVSGPPGSGKTRLVQHAARQLGRPVVYGRAFSAEKDETWSLFRTLVQEAAALFPDSIESLPGRIATALATLVPELQADLGSPAGTIDPQSLRTLAAQGGVRVLEEAARRGAVVVIDDLQWCDPTSASVLSAAFERIDALPLVLAHRPNELEDPVLGIVRSQDPEASIELGPLGPEAVAGFFVDPALGRAVADQIDGNPLALSELIRTLVAARVLRAEPGDRWSASSPDAAERAAEAARGGRLRSIGARVRSLPVPAQQVIRVLALLGHPAPARLLAAASRIDEGAVLDSLELLARHTLVRLGDEGWLPAHDLVGEAVVAQLSREERARLHAALARSIGEDRTDRSEVARHLQAAGDRPAAARAFLAAGRAALERYASREAEELASSGLALSPEQSTQAELLAVRAEARERAGRISEARQDLRSALAGTESGPARSAILSRMALLISGADDYAHAGELAQLALTEAGPDLPAQARALAVGSMVEGNLGNLNRAESLAARALELFNRLDDANGAADILELQGLNLVYAGRLTDGVTLLGRVVSLFRDSGKLMRIGPTVTFRALGLRLMLRLDEAVAELDEQLELELQLGTAEGECWCRAVRGLILADLGRIEESKSESQKALGIARAIGHKELLAGSLLNYGWALQVDGDLDRAVGYLSESARVAAGLPAFLCFAESALARIEVERGNLDDAESHLRAALAAGFPFALYLAELAHAELMVARGDPGASEQVAKYRSSAQSGGARYTAVLLEKLIPDLRKPAPLHDKTGIVVT